MDNIAWASGSARHTKARMAYSLFLESFIIPTYLLEIKITRDPKLLKISKNIALDRTLQGRIIPMFPIISIDLIDIKESLRMSQVQESQEQSSSRLGSIENPEVYTNLPGHVIPILQREFDDFDNEVQPFLNGARTPAAFT